jgi:hypothetical protein
MGRPAPRPTPRRRWRRGRGRKPPQGFAITTAVWTTRSCGRRRLGPPEVQEAAAHGQRDVEVADEALETLKPRPRLAVEPRHANADRAFPGRCPPPPAGEQRELMTAA